MIAADDDHYSFGGTGSYFVVYMGMNADTEHAPPCQITLAGGCFWDIEAGFRGVPGILATVVGYTGGDEENPDYVQVSTGETGHVEAVRIAYDPEVIALEEILSRFFGLFDPTVPEQETGSSRSQISSVIFCHSEEDCQAYMRLSMKQRFRGDIMNPLWLLCDL